MKAMTEHYIMMLEKELDLKNVDKRGTRETD